MLEYDDQLPEELAHPELLRELQTNYRRNQKEEQVLARVRAQLLEKTAQPPSVNEISVPEDAPRSGRTRVQPLPRRKLYQRRWMQRMNSLVAVLFAMALVGALALTFFGINHFKNSTGTPAAPEEVNTFVNLNEGLRLYMVNEQVGWEMGDSAHNPFSTVLHTTDGGKHWRTVTPGGLQMIGAIYIIDGNTAWVPVWNVKRAMYPSALYRTVNGGATWQYFNCPNSPLTCGLSVFADQNHGWSLYQPASGGALQGSPAVFSHPPIKVVNPKFYRTSDGGKTWQPVAEFPNAGVAPQYRFLNAQTGWVSTKIIAAQGPSMTAELYITHDSGRTWKTQSLPIPPGVRDHSQPDVGPLPTFFNEHEGYLIAQSGSHSYLYITQDGGDTWQVSGNALPDNFFPKSLLDMHHLIGTVPASGPPIPLVLGDLAMLTLTNGKWVETPLPLPHNSPVVDYSFTSKDKGIALVNGSASTFDLYKTIDGGKTWQKISTLLKSS